jgi:hypothetical protein
LIIPESGLPLIIFTENHPPRGWPSSGYAGAKKIAVKIKPPEKAGGWPLA